MPKSIHIRHAHDACFLQISHLVIPGLFGKQPLTPRQIFANSTPKKKNRLQLFMRSLIIRGRFGHRKNPCWTSICPNLWSIVLYCGIAFEETSRSESNCVLCTGITCSTSYNPFRPGFSELTHNLFLLWLLCSVVACRGRSSECGSTIFRNESTKGADPCQNSICTEQIEGLLFSMVSDFQAALIRVVVPKFLRYPFLVVWGRVAVSYLPLRTCHAPK